MALRRLGREPVGAQILDPRRKFCIIRLIAVPAAVKIEKGALHPSALPQIWVVQQQAA